MRYTGAPGKNEVVISSYAHVLIFLLQYIVTSNLHIYNTGTELIIEAELEDRRPWEFILLVERVGKWTHKTVRHVLLPLVLCGVGHHLMVLMLLEHLHCPPARVTSRTGMWLDPSLSPPASIFTLSSVEERDKGSKGQELHITIELP